MATYSCFCEGCKVSESSDESKARQEAANVAHQLNLTKNHSKRITVTILKDSVAYGYFSLG